MKASELYSAASAFDLAFVAEEVFALQRIGAAYNVALASILSEIERLDAQVRDAAQRGEDYSARLWRLRRLEGIAERIEGALSEAEFVSAQTTGGSAETVVLASADNTRELILRQARAVGGTVVEATVNVNYLTDLEPIRRALAFNATGSPVLGAIEKRSPAFAAQFEETLYRGLGQGWNPRKMAREAERLVGVEYQYAELVYRTEAIRALRSASHATMNAYGSDVLSGWIWNAHLDGRRTCAACIALHGKWFPLSVVMGSHIMCRCAQVPAVKGSDSWVTVDGSEWFAAQDRGYQLAILGGKKFEAYEAGEFDLDDIIGYQDSRKYGPQRFERSLKDLRRNPGLAPGAFPDQAGRPEPPSDPETVKPGKLSRKAEARLVEVSDLDKAT